MDLSSKPTPVWPADMQNEILQRSSLPNYRALIVKRREQTRATIRKVLLKLVGRKITPHVARNDKRRGGSAIDSRASRNEGYKTSQKIRKRIEEGFGWSKAIGLIRQVNIRGLARVNAAFSLTFIS